MGWAEPPALNKAPLPKLLLDAIALTAASAARGRRWQARSLSARDTELGFYHECTSPWPSSRPVDALASTNSAPASRHDGVSRRVG